MAPESHPSRSTSPIDIPVVLEVPASLGIQQGFEEVVEARWDTEKLQKSLFKVGSGTGTRGPDQQARATASGSAALQLMRAQKGLPNQELASLLGCSGSHLTNVISGRATASQALLKGIGRLLVTPTINELAGPVRAFIPDLGLLRNSPDTEEAEPRHHVGFDKLVVVGQVSRPGAFIKGWREWLSPYRPTDRRVPLAGRSQRVTAFDHAGNLRVLEVCPSRMDMWEAPYKTHKYKANYEVFDAAVVGRRLLAIISVGPYRVRCTGHRGTPRIVCKKCAAKNIGYQWQCFRCCWKNRCDKCDDASALRPHIRCEITGQGFASGLGAIIVQKLFRPQVIAGSIRADHIHLALDLELPTRSLVPFQAQQVPGVRGASAAEVYANGSDGLAIGSVYLGARGSAKRVVIYDKLAQTNDTWGQRPAHARDWQHITRIEFRLRPQKLVVVRPVHDLLGALPKLWATLGLADLRYADRDDPMSVLLGLARLFPLTSGAASLSRLDKVRTGVVPKMRMTFRDRLLSLTGNPHRDDQGRVDAVNALQAAVEAELLALSQQRPVDVGAMMERALPALQASLNAALQITQPALIVAAPNAVENIDSLTSAIASSASGTVNVRVTADLFVQAADKPQPASMPKALQLDCCDESTRTVPSWWRSPIRPAFSDAGDGAASTATGWHRVPGSSVAVWGERADGVGRGRGGHLESPTSEAGTADAYAEVRALWGASTGSLAQALAPPVVSHRAA